MTHSVDNSAAIQLGPIRYAQAAWLTLLLLWFSARKIVLFNFSDGTFRGAEFPVPLQIGILGVLAAIAVFGIVLTLVAMTQSEKNRVFATGLRSSLGMGIPLMPLLLPIAWMTRMFRFRNSK